MREAGRVQEEEFSEEKARKGVGCLSAIAPEGRDVLGEVKFGGKEGLDVGDVVAGEVWLQVRAKSDSNGF